MADGRIITFYSFKGGVGRTMALANVAYLAAYSGKRVLIMDWDLEAPGLAYYFRGFINAEQNDEIRKAPGVLNVLWDWSQQATTSAPQALETLITRFDSGEVFDACVRPIMEADFLPSHSALDYIGAGSPSIDSQQPRAYEQALSDFSWQGFFQAASGGVVIDAWRSWAKRNYDLVLVDSRTGLADAAGVCTMQLPDEVALCFILNRQNIEGIANVSAAIRANGSERIRLRAVPMRTARQDTAEESDAKARTQTELTGLGGFSTEAIQRDMDELTVSAAENVPFYEILSPFAPSSPSLDLLSFNYRRLAKHLLGEDIKEPDISPSLRLRVRQRLQRRHTTLEYLDELRSGDPARLASELETLLSTAIADAEAGNILPEEYSQRLIEATYDLDVDFENEYELQFKALGYLRKLYDKSEQRWLSTLIQLLEALISTARTLRYNLSDEDCALFEELDNVLLTAISFEHRLKRIQYKTQLAEHYWQMSQECIFGPLVLQARAMMDELRNDPQKLTGSLIKELLLADFTLLLLEGALLEQREKPEEAASLYIEALERIDLLTELTDWTPLRRCKIEFMVRLALGRTGTPTGRAMYAIAAVEISTNLVGFASRFVALGQAVYEANDASLLNRYLNTSLEVSGKTGIGIAKHLAYNTTRGLQFLRWVLALLMPTGASLMLTADNVQKLANVTQVVIDVAAHRGRNIGRAEGISEFFDVAKQLIECFRHHLMEDSALAALSEVVAQLEQRMRREHPL